MSKNPKVVEETRSILEMFAALDRSYNLLSAEGKQTVTRGIGNTERFGFEGFDDNEAEHSSAAFELSRSGQLDHLGIVKQWADRNSHTSASIIVYRRMLVAYQSMLKQSNLTAEDTLSPAQIILIVRATAAHPIN